MRKKNSTAAAVAVQYFMAPAEAKKEADISNIKDMVRIAAHGDR
jgi:hypothetical protein